MTTHHKVNAILFFYLFLSLAHFMEARERERVLPGIKMTEHNLGKTCIEEDPCPEDKWGSDLSIDLYQPSKQTRKRHWYMFGHHALRGRQLIVAAAGSGDGIDGDGKQTPLPFLILACGGNADKRQYSRYATGLALRGYTVAVMNKIIFMPQPTETAASTEDTIKVNAATPVDFNRVIEFVQSNKALLGIDAESVVLLGHSFGGAMALAAARGFCYSFFCGDNDPVSTTMTESNFPVELSPTVMGAFVYGVSIYQAGFPGEPLDLELTNVNQQTMESIPFFFFWGEHERLVGEIRDGEYMYRTTWENQEEIKAYVIGKEMDHDSIANEGFSNRNIVNSTLPRRIQVGRTVSATDAWIQYLMEEEEDIKSSLFCFRLGVPFIRNENNELQCKLEA